MFFSFSLYVYKQTLILSLGLIFLTIVCVKQYTYFRGKKKLIKQI